MHLNEWLETELQQNIFTKKYMYQNESLDEFFNRTSNGNENIKRLMIEKKFLFAGRTLANRNTHKEASYSNCYSSGYAPDSVEGIMDLCKNMALTYKAQGGQGVSLSKIRPKDTGVKHNTFKSDGIIPFMELLNQTTASISQGGSRKGALMMSLDCWHKEIIDFINIKSKLDSITKANLSVEIDNEFMNAVIAFYTTGEIITKTITRNYEGNEVTYEIVPIDVFNAMVERAYDWAEPGVIFVDEFRNYNLMEYDDDYMVITGNPCFTGDMKLLTVDGYKTFKELDNTNVQIINANNEISNSKVWCSGIKEIVSIKLYNNKSIKCTPDHIFKLNDGTECKAMDLKKKRLMPHLKTKYNFDDLYVKLGFIQGDGNLTRLNSERHKGLEINIGKNDNDVLKFFKFTKTTETQKTFYTSEFNDILYKLGFDGSILPERVFPITYTTWNIKQRLSFIRGCYSANGSVIKLKRIAYKTTSKIFALQLQKALKNDCDISTYITTNKSKSVKFNNGDYICKESYDINMNQYNDIVKFYENIGFIHNYKIQDLYNVIITRSPCVMSVKKLQSPCNVYDFNEPLTNWGVVEGIIVHNCSEQPLPKDGACNLGSINLSEYVLNPYTENPQFDYVVFINDVSACIKAMDDVIDEGSQFHALQSQIDMSTNYRNIGLGVMGIGEMLIKLNIIYGSGEAIELLDNITYHMFRTAVKASNQLAYEKGTFPKYTDKVFDSTIMHNHFSVQEIEELKQWGLRNCSLLSIAPTGSIGTMFNISGGIEPVFAIKHTRKTESLHKDKDQYYDVFCKSAQEYMSLYPNNNLPQWFVEAEDIPWGSRIDMQAVAQKSIDTAISSTINLPNNATIDDIAWLFITAWEKKLKGCTVYRSGCKREGILTNCNNENINLENNNKNKFILPRGFIEEVPKDLTYRKYKLRSGCGNVYFFVGVDEYENKIYDCFTNTDGQGGCTVNTIANSRLLSASLRGGVPIQYLIQQLEHSGSCPAYQNVRGRQTGALKIKNMLPEDIDISIISQINEYIGKPLSNGKSCASAFSYILKNICKEFENEEHESLSYTKANKNEILNNEYTECTHPNQKMVEGCSVCPDCGYSKCS